MKEGLKQLKADILDEMDSIEQVLKDLADIKIKTSADSKEKPLYLVKKPLKG